MVNMHDQVVKAENGQVNGDSFDQTAEAVVELAPKNYCGGIPSTALFIAKYHQYPCTLDCEGASDDIQFHVTTIVQGFAKRFKYNAAKDTITRDYHRRTKKTYISSRMINLTHGVVVHLKNCSLETDVQNPNKLAADHADEYFLVTKNIEILYLPEHDDLAEELFAQFSTMTVFTPSTCTLQMVCRNQHGYYLSGIKIKKPLITDMGLHYGPKFVGIHDKIIQNLNQKEGKGIVLLHGVPGSGKTILLLLDRRWINILYRWLGKTHYIRYLIQEVQDKTLIYIPPDMAKEISSPAFLPFLMEYPESILIIEDAENIIKDRNETLVPSQAVANLLNL